MDLTGLLPVVRRWWAVLLGTLALAGVAGYLVATTLPPSYEAEAQVLVGPVSAPLATLQAAAQLAQTYAELAVTEPVLEAVAESLDVSRGSVRRAVAVTADEVTRLVSVRATTGDAARAAAIANAVAEELTRLAVGREAVASGALSIVDQATVPRRPVAPDRMTFAALGAAGGTAVCFVVLTWLEASSRVVRSRERLAKIAGREVAGTVLPLAGWGSAVVRAPISRAAGSFRRLAAAVEHRLGEVGGRTVVVCGAQTHDEGAKVAGELAAAFGVGGRQVALVIADGSEWTDDDLPHVHIERFEGLRLPALDRVGARSRIVDRVRARQAVARLADADVVVVAAPPINESSDALAWAGGLDLVVVAVTLGRSTVDEVRDAADGLLAAEADAAVLAAVEPAGQPGRRGRWRDAQDDELGTTAGWAGAAAAPGSASR